MQRVCNYSQIDWCITDCIDVLWTMSDTYNAAFLQKLLPIFAKCCVIDIRHCPQYKMDKCQQIH